MGLLGNRVKSHKCEGSTSLVSFLLEGLSMLLGCLSVATHMFCICLMGAAFVSDTMVFLN
jgi:hypothetical protein